MPNAAQRDNVSGTLIGLAVGDALGAPVEFKQRDSFPEIREMHAGGYFRLPAGAWTDDTAMALCLADSLLYQPEFNEGDLLNRFLRWIDDNENTSTGRCIGVGQNTMAVLGNYRRTGALLAPVVKGRSDGNGALMRLAPVACMHWREPLVARSIARRQSYTTHASELSSAACEAQALLLCGLISGLPWDDALSGIAQEAWPPEIASIIAGGWKAKSRGDISSTGYVVHTLEAAIWAVGTTSTFEDALITAVNLGHDADTVGAVAGQLAGARYGSQEIPSRWLAHLFHRDQITDIANQLFAASTRSHLEGCP